MTTPFPFVAAQVLTANELNSITNLPSSTKTVSYVLTIANAGARVLMNAAGSTTITANTSIFSANDIVELSNIGAGVCTVTAGTATVSSAGPLAIPQYGGGRLVFTSASAAIYFPSAVTVAAPAAAGLTFLSSQTLSQGATLSITNVFSATYTNYLFITNQMNQVADNQNTFLQFGSSGTADASANYNIRKSFSSTANNQTSFNIGGNSGTTNNYFVATFTNPNVAATTFMSFTCLNNFSGGAELVMGAGLINNSTQYTDIFFTAGGGNMGAMKYQLFGYANS